MERHGGEFLRAGFNSSGLPHPQGRMAPAAVVEGLQPIEPRIRAACKRWLKVTEVYRARWSD